MMIKVINEKEEEEKALTKFSVCFCFCFDDPETQRVCVWMDSIFDFFVCCCVSIIMNVNHHFTEDFMMIMIMVMVMAMVG